MKDYKISKAKQNGREMKQIKIIVKGKIVFHRIFEEEQTDKVIRQADLYIIKHNLKYNTKKLKPIL